jgi:hypothetical protein
VQQYSNKDLDDMLESAWLLLTGSKFYRELIKATERNNVESFLKGYVCRNIGHHSRRPN